MAEVIENGEFWLPPEFLSDDDFIKDGVKAENNTKNLNDGFGFGFGFGFEIDSSKSLFSGFGSFRFSSDLSSPVEGSTTETESDEEDYLTGLTRQMTHSTLEDESRRNHSFAAENPKGWVLSSSPQSTLCALPSGCGCNKQGSSRGSPNCQSRVSSPQPGTWDLLYAAAGEVERLRMNEGFNRGLLDPPAIKPLPNLDGVSGFYPQQSLSHNKLRTTHFQQLKQQQLMNQQNALAWGGLNLRQQIQQPQPNHVVQNRGRLYGNRALCLSPSVCPPMQQQPQPQPNGSGMRAVFMGNPNGKRECAGTGVFLPRVGNSSESRKKQGCSTALVPARVAQALNLNLDEIGSQPQPQPQPQHPRFSSGFTPDAAAVRLRSGGNVLGNQRQRNFRSQQDISHEPRLPQEWTY